MGAFNPNEYIEVADRIPLFWAKHPTGAIETDIAHMAGPEVIVRAALFADGASRALLATGYAREVEGKSPVNKTSHVENAETSAIGRALANAGFTGSAKRASRQEMEKVQRQQAEHDEMLEYVRVEGKRVSEALQARIRGEWNDAKQRIVVARALADAVEAELQAAEAA